MTNLVAQLQVDGVYTTYPVFEAEGTSIQLGPDVDQELRPNTLDLTWKNADLSMDPSNAASPLYGKIGRNTPVRVRIGPGPSTVFAGEASQWEPDETLRATATTGRRWVGMEAAGASRRIGQWTDNLDSALRRQNGAVAGLLGYWPAEGGTSDTTVLSEVSGAAGAAAGSVAGTIDFGGDPGPGGGDTALTIGSSGALAARFARVTTSGYQVVFHCKLKTLPTSSTYLEFFGCNLSNGDRLQVMINSNTFLFQVSDPTGAVKGSFASNFGTGVDPTSWVRYRIKATISAGTVLIEPAWYPQDALVIYGVSFTYANTGTGALLNWQVSDNAWTDGAAYGHILATSNTAVDLISDYAFVNAFNGYLGETAAARLVRLFGEQGELFTLIGNLSDGIAMGRQKPDSLINLAEECRRTDGGLLFDNPTSGIVTYRTRRNIENQTPVLALTKGINVAPPLKPLIGDQLIANDVTVNNADGTKARVVISSGSMSVQPPPAGAGRYTKSLDVNMASPLLLTDRGNWAAAIGTTDRRWYKQITVDLLATPSLLSTLVAMKPGDLVTLAGAEADLVNLIYLSMQWQIQAAPTKAVLTCVPGDVWTSIGVYDDAGSAKDASFSTTAATFTAGATAVSVTNPVLEDCWSTTAVPYNVKIGGEVMTVTAATAPAGTGPYTQTLTVTRSVNGIVKAHTVSGESVNLARPVYYAFG